VKEGWTLSETEDVVTGNGWVTLYRFTSPDAEEDDHFEVEVGAYNPIGGEPGSFVRFPIGPPSMSVDADAWRTLIRTCRAD
jgi:hypothetical protein